MSMGRRDWLRGTLASGVTLAMAPWGVRASAAEPTPKAQGVIHLFLPGGMAHQESFDPKPYAPLEYRGPFKPIKTVVDDLQLGAHFKKTARIADKITVVRSMTHGEAAHERGTHNMFTGYKPSPSLRYPSLGSVISHELGPRKSLPPYVCIPQQPNTYAGSGYLSSAYGPFSLGADPSGRNYSVRDLELPEGVDVERFERRRRLLETVDEHFTEREESDDVAAMESFYERAYALVESAEARDAFRIEQEPKKLRERYGMGAAGQRMLLARRLVERGVRYVATTFGGWDHHDGIKAGFDRNAPALDQAYASLIRDLDDRGMLDSTLVLLTTEFGRTPKINRTEGRDHWPKVFSIALAGGGIQRGLVYGRSNAQAAEPDEDPLTVEDLAATMYHLVGIDSDKRLLSPGDRPIDIVRGGRVVEALLA